MRNWRAGRNRPQHLGSIEWALFGDNETYSQWRLDLRGAYDGDKRSSEDAAIPRPSEPSPSDAHLVFESKRADLPTKVPPEGQVYTLPLFYSPDSGVEQIGLSVRHGQPGSDLEWFRDLRFPQVYRCEITNYGSAPLLQVILEFGVEYREVTKDVANTSTAKSGDVVYSRQWPVLLSKIDPGKSNAAIFFVYNQSRYLAVVIPPEVGSYIALGETAQRQARLLPIGMFPAMSLWPPEQMK